MSPARALLLEQMAAAVAYGARHVREGGIPFVGALLEGDRLMSPYGVNRVRETGDPSAHAEIEAMRHVLAQRGAGGVRDMVLLATGEPCGLCYRFAREQGVAHVYFAVGRDDAAAWGFDYRASYTRHAVTQALLTGWAERLAVEGAMTPFQTFDRLRPAGGYQQPDRS